MAKDNFETPEFLRDDEDDAPVASHMQLWTDSYLKSLSKEDVALLAARSSKLSDSDKERRTALVAEMESCHAAHVFELPKRLRFNAPGRGMTQARAKLVVEQWQNGTITAPIPLPARVEATSVLDS